MKEPLSLCWMSPASILSILQRLHLIVGVDTASFSTAVRSGGFSSMWVSEQILSISLSSSLMLHSLLTYSHNSVFWQHRSSKTAYHLQEENYLTWYQKETPGTPYSLEGMHPPSRTCLCQSLYPSRDNKYNSYWRKYSATCSTMSEAIAVV